MCISLLAGTAGSWEHEKSRRALKWREERRKESYSKDDSEKDSDTGDEPDNLEPPEVASARENIAALVGEQKKLRKQKVYGVGWRAAWGQGCGQEEGRRPESSSHKSWMTLPSFYVSVCLILLKWEGP